MVMTFPIQKLGNACIANYVRNRFDGRGYRSSFSRDAFVLWYINDYFKIITANSSFILFIDLYYCLLPKFQPKKQSNPNESDYKIIDNSVACLGIVC